LYHFNADEELAEYSLPVLSNQIGGKNSAMKGGRTSAMNQMRSSASRASGLGDMDGMDFDQEA
jgi:hypothetical protein